MSRIYNEDDNVCHVGYISVVPSVSSIASSMSNVSLTSSQFRCIPDYIVFGCEFRYISRRQATPVRWDIVKNCALSNGYPQLFSKGEKGIKQVTGAVRRLSNENNGNRFTFDKTTGLYVHIGLSKQPFYIEDIKKICHNFLKYESCLNLIMSPNRIDNDDCLSNRSLFSKDNLETRDLIYECETVKDLQLRMCKNASNFKLNLMNLSTKGRESSLFSRFHYYICFPLKVQLSFVNMQAHLMLIKLNYGKLFKYYANIILL